MGQSRVLLCLFQKNPQIMYLEQELESLKAVLEIKNEKLHQQDVKLMKMEKLVGLLPGPPPPPERTVSVKQARGSELQPWDGLSCPCRLFGNFTNGKRGFIFFSVIAQGSVIAASGNSSPLPHPHPTEQAEQHGVLGEPQQTNQAPISVVDESSPAFEEFLNNVKAVTLMYHQLWAGFVCPKQLDL